MSNKRKTIGRTFAKATVNPQQNNIEQQAQTFTLGSGQKAAFKLAYIEAAELADKTYVELETNGRDQQALTEESVADIARTITLQQFFPAIGCKVDGKIEILDGSRRRAAALFKQVGLAVLITEDNISVDDARQLATDIQTAREHNLREVGMRLLALRDAGMNQKEIAEANKLSPAKVTRAIQAASVPAEMLTVFPDQSELNYPDYKLLLEISSGLEAKGLDLVDLVAQIMVEKDELAPELTLEDIKNALMKAYRRHSNLMMAAPAKAKAKLEKLWEFDDKDVFARKRSKARSVSYEFSRMPKSLQKELDEVIRLTLDKHLS